MEFYQMEFKEMGLYEMNLNRSMDCFSRFRFMFICISSEYDRHSQVWHWGNRVVLHPGDVSVGCVEGRKTDRLRDSRRREWQRSVTPRPLPSAQVSRRCRLQTLVLVDKHVRILHLRGRPSQLLLRNGLYQHKIYATLARDIRHRWRIHIS